MNNDFVLGQAKLLAERAIAEAGDDLPDRVRMVWRLALVQEPTEAEVESAAAFVAAQQEELSRKKREGKEPAAKDAAPPAEIAALASFCQALFSSNGFLYVD
jgi:hypothetical protein